MTRETANQIYKTIDTIEKFEYRKELLEKYGPEKFFHELEESEREEIKSLLQMYIDGVLVELNKKNRKLSRLNSW